MDNEKLKSILEELDEGTSIFGKSSVAGVDGYIFMSYPRWKEAFKYLLSARDGVRELYAESTSIQ